MHIYMLTKLHCNIFYKHIIWLFGLTKQQLEGGFQTTGGMISFCYSTCIIFVTYFFCDLFFKVSEDMLMIPLLNCNYMYQ